MAKVFGMFAKYPEPGQVKSRLARDLGSDQATEWYEFVLKKQVNRFRTIADRRILGFSPDEARSREWFTSLSAGDYELWPQPETDLGRRMESFFRDHLDHNQVVLIGSDSPTLPDSYLSLAFRYLEECEIVVGPATDGGYYLIGMTSRVWPVFEEIEWSTPYVFLQTVQLIERCGAKLGVLPIWHDVDELNDLGLHSGLSLAQTVAIRSPWTDGLG